MSGYSFDSFFKKTISDNNNQTVTDINEGLNKLFNKYVLNEVNLQEDQRYLVSENEEGYPDLVAKNSILNDPSLWWWFLLSNRLEYPLEDIEHNYTYSVVNQNQMKRVVNDSWANTIVSGSNTNSKIGKIVELN